MSNLTRSRLARFGLVVLLAFLAAPPVVAEETLSDLRRQREQAREAELAALAEVALLEQDDAVIAATLQQIESLVDAQAARVAGAKQALDAAEAEVVRREQAAAEADIAVQATKAEILDRAVDAFVRTERSVEPWLGSADVNRTAVRLAMLDFASGNERDLVDDLRATVAVREANLEAGQAAQAEADRLRGEVEAELAQLIERQAVQLDVQAELRKRIDAYEAEADAFEAESAEFTALLRSATAEATGLAPGSASLEGYIMPTDGRIGSGFGPRLHPIFGSVRKHTGVDIGAASGDPIWAAKDGRVIFAGTKGGYGNAVVLIHGDGQVSTLYAHMSKILVAVGDVVDQGEVIGKIGSTGNSTGPHLHFEVRVNGEPKDPVAFLP